MGPSERATSIYTDISSMPKTHHTRLSWTDLYIEISCRIIYPSSHSFFFFFFFEVEERHLSITLQISASLPEDAVVIDLTVEEG